MKLSSKIKSSKTDLGILSQHSQITNTCCMAKSWLGNGKQVLDVAESPIIHETVMSIYLGEHLTWEIRSKV